MTAGREMIEKKKKEKISDSAHFFLRKGVIIIGAIVFGLSWMKFFKETFIVHGSVISPGWLSMLSMYMCLVLTTLLILCYFIDRSLCRLISVFLILSAIGLLIPGYM